MKKIAVLDVCLCAAAIALHIVLELFLTIRIGNDLKITLAALPFMIIAFLCGPGEGLVSGLTGTFLSQLITFGITVTTPLWILPYAIQALLAGLIFGMLKKKITVKVMGICVFVSGFAAVILNFIASYVDGVIVFKYMTFEVLVGLLPLRLLVWIIISVIFTAVTVPLTKALIRSCPAGLKIKRKRKQNEL